MSNDISKKTKALFVYLIVILGCLVFHYSFPKVGRTALLFDIVYRIALSLLFVGLLVGCAFLLKVIYQGVKAYTKKGRKLYTWGIGRFIFTIVVCFTTVMSFIGLFLSTQRIYFDILNYNHPENAIEVVLIDYEVSKFGRRRPEYTLYGVDEQGSEYSFKVDGRAIQGSNIKVIYFENTNHILCIKCINNE